MTGSYRGLIGNSVRLTAVDLYSCTMLQGNYHGMILLQKNIGGGGWLN
jgi:hypothetical protein